MYPGFLAMKSNCRGQARAPLPIEYQRGDDTTAEDQSSSSKRGRWSVKDVPRKVTF